MTKKEALAIILANPGCVAKLDNDCWSIERPKPKGFNQWSDSRQEQWHERESLLFSSIQVPECDYGGGLVEVLALAVSMTCEDV